MPAVAMLWRSELRRAWLSLVVVALVTALVGGVTLAALAGARRSSTAFDRLREQTLHDDVTVFADDARAADIAKLRRLSGVAAVGYARQLALVRPDGEFLAVGGALDDSVYRDVDRPRIVDGRLPRPDSVNEIVLPEPLARRAHLRVGDALGLRRYSQADVNQLLQGAADVKPSPLPMQLHVVGISRDPVDLSIQGSEGGVLFVGREFVEKYGADIGNFSGPHGAVLLVRLEDGAAGVGAFLQQLRTILGDRPFSVDPAALSTGGVQESIDLIAIAVLVFGMVAAVSGLIALGLVIARQVALVASRQRPLRDLGLSWSANTVATGGPVAFACVLGVLAAIAVAWFASSLFPFGVAGDAEPHPGRHFDATLAGGAALLIVIVVAMVWITTWRALRSRADASPRRRPSVLARALESHAFAPPATVGTRMALEPGRGRTAIPVRSALVGTALIVLGIAAVTVFGSSLSRLDNRPASFGVVWDAYANDPEAFGQQYKRLCSGPVPTRLVDDGDIDALATACAFSVELNGRAVFGLGLAPLRGSITPTVLSGRAPAADDEVALGSQTMEALHVGIGDTVTARTRARTAEYRVVGRIVVPAVADPQAIADGSVFTGRGAERLRVPGDDDVSATAALVFRFKDGVDHDAAAARVGRLPGIDNFGVPGVGVPETPLEVTRLEQIRRIPLVLGAFLAVIGTIAIGYLLVTSVTRRRRDFAVLKTIGFTRRQVTQAVAWQATTVSMLGIIAGVVLGIGVGALTWRRAAQWLGVVPLVSAPVVWIAGIVVGVLLVANLVAAWPGRRAARTRVAVALRAE